MVVYLSILWKMSGGIYFNTLDNEWWYIFQYSGQWVVVYISILWTMSGGIYFNIRDNEWWYIFQYSEQWVMVYISILLNIIWYLYTAKVVVRLVCILYITNMNMVMNINVHVHIHLLRYTAWHMSDVVGSRVFSCVAYIWTGLHTAEHDRFRSGQSLKVLS